MTTDYQTKEAKIKELIAKATSPRDKAFYQGLLKKAIASRPVQVMEFAESVKSEHNSKEASVTEKKQKTSSSTTELDKSQSSKEKPKSETVGDENGLAKKAHGDDKSILEDKSTEHESIQSFSSPQQLSTESNLLKDEKPPGIFQAIGVIKGLVFLSEGRLNIQLGDKNYELKSALQDRRKILATLKQEIEKKGSCEKALVVYPYVYYFQKSEEQQRRIAFRLARRKQVDLANATWNQLIEREFIISGLWQYIPRCSIPCLTIRRNWSERMVEYLEEISSQPKNKLLKPSHLPVEWGDAPVEPFRYSLESEQKGEKSWFVRVKAVFVPGEDRFKVIGQLAEPTLERPRYLSAHP